MELREHSGKFIPNVFHQQFFLLVQIIFNLLYAYSIQPVATLASLQKLLGYIQRFLYGLALLYFYISYHTELNNERNEHLNYENISNA